ncbi:MAG: BatA domain-containing protein, partial [Planctomycetota bacterium]|nr:BatA domain-containing protein [Planctomycetota bacterium]
MHWNLLMWGGLATSVPLIIHLLNRRRFRVVRWAAMEFVLKAVKQNKKRIRLENFLLLLLRMLLIFLIALFVARTQSGGGVLSVLPGASESIERIFIIDDSASLDQKFGGKTAYERAVEASIEFCEELIDKESSDVVTIVIGSKAAIAKRRLAPKVAKEELKLLLKRKAVDIPIDLVSAVKTVVDGKDASESGEDANDEDMRKVLYVMTDMREVDWIGPNQSKAKRLGAQLRKFQDEGEKKAEVLLIDVASDDVGNVGIIDFKCRDKVILSKIDAKFQASIKNFGLKEVNNLQIMLKVGNTSVPSKSIKSLRSGQSLEINFSHRFSSPGVTPVSIKIVGGEGDKDVLSRDNQRHLSIEVLESINLLVVDGEAARGDDVEESYFISSALAPTDRFSVSCKVIDSDDILDEDLNQFHAILLCNLDYWPEQRLLALKTFVKRGGGLGIYLGDRVNARRYMSDFWDKGKGFLPSPIGEIKGS